MVGRVDFTRHLLIEAEVSRSFDEMMDIALVAVDFDDPTTNVGGRRALMNLDEVRGS